MKLWTVEPHQRDADDTHRSYCGWTMPDDETTYVVEHENEEHGVCSREHALKLVYEWGRCYGEENPRLADPRLD